LTKLQLAIDLISLDKAVEVVRGIEDYVDIIEIGTPFLIENGLDAVRKFRKEFPSKEILCDGKIMDAASYEAAGMINAGADYITILGVTDTLSIADAVKTAHTKNAKVVVDMICVKDIEKRVSELENLGVDYFAVHTGVDQQAAGFTPLDDLRTMTGAVKSAGVAVAGGIGVNTVDDYMEYNPEIIIVGNGILGQENIHACAKAIYEKIHGRRD